MFDTPATKYARSRNGRIAYQEFGDGPLKLVYAPGTFNHLDFMWSDPGYTRFLRQLGNIARVVAFDRLGVGLSDRLTQVPPLEDRAIEIETVMDAVGFKRASILAASENAAAAAFFAATHTHRVTSLVLCGAFFLGVRDEVPWSLPADTFRQLKTMSANWGNGDSVEFVAPSVANFYAIRKLWGTFERAVATPAEVETYVDFIWDLDATAAVSCIPSPTLVVARTGDRICPIAQSRKLAELIPDAKLVELPGDDHVPWFGDLDAYLDPVEAFLSGTVTDRKSTTRMVTLLMTDIVGSTNQLSVLGDDTWAGMVLDHDLVCREAIEAHGGEVIDRTGDGFLSAFRGPYNAAKCAISIIETLAAKNIQLRAGIHAGQVVLVDRYMQGIAVNTCARICGQAAAGEILSSKVIRDLLPRLIEVESAGAHDLKGIGVLELFRVGRIFENSPINKQQTSVSLMDAVVRRVVRAAPYSARVLMNTLKGLDTLRFRRRRAA